MANWKKFDVDTKSGIGTGKTKVMQIDIEKLTHIFAPPENDWVEVSIGETSMILVGDQGELMRKLEME